MSTDALVKTNLTGAAIRLRKVMKELRLTYDQAQRLVEGGRKAT